MVGVCASVRLCALYVDRSVVVLAPCRRGAGRRTAAAQARRACGVYEASADQQATTAARSLLLPLSLRQPQWDAERVGGIFRGAAVAASDRCADVAAPSADTKSAVVSAVRGRLCAAAGADA